MKISCLSISFFFLGLIASAQDANSVPEKKAESPKKAQKQTVKVKRDLLETRLELEGVLESRTSTPIRVIPKSWSDLTVDEVVEHGTMVKKGDVILRFETEKLIKAIEDQEEAIPLADLRLETAKYDLSLLEQTGPIELEAKRKSKAEKEADFAYFEEVRRPMDERGARERLKSYQDRLSYTEEELRQLTKMYENDDITEETEEIILKRARDSVEGDRWALEQVKASTDRALNVSIPREHESMTRDLKLTQLDWRGAEKKAKRDLDTKRLEVAEQERNFVKSTEKIAELKSDLETFVVKAPHDGIVYYGATSKGKSITAAAVEKKLIPGGKASSGEVLLTVVDPEVLHLHVSVAEDKLKDLKEGQKAELAMKWNDDLKMDSVVESISYIPEANSTFDTVFSFDRAQADFPAYPGMSAKITINTYRNENALVVPLKAFRKDGDKSYVIMKGGEKRWVETGRADKEVREITGGLKEGDEIEADISSAKPDEKK